MKTPKKQSINRKHNFPDASLYQKGIEALRIYSANRNKFDDIGYKFSDASALNNHLKQMIEMTPDDDYLGRQMILTEKKQEAHRNLLAAIRELMNIVAQAFDPTTGQYRRFGTSRLGDQSSEKLMFIARNVVRVATEYFPVLQQKGATERLLDRIRQRTGELQQACMNQVDIISDRDIATEARVAKSNDVYDHLLLLCAAGQIIFQNDKQHYEHFKLYDSNMEQKRAKKSQEEEE